MSLSTAMNESTEARLDTPQGTCVLTYEPLHSDQIIASVGDERAGAIAVFIGTTRNSFRGKTVTRLEYQAYSKLAIKTIAKIMQSTLDIVSNSDHHPESHGVPPLIHCAVHHRLGNVPVGEPSVVIAVSTPGRKAAFMACEFILEELKRKAQIWKREYYEGEREDEAEWKVNS